MSKTNHLHKYKRVKLGKTYTVYKCMKPACNHYIRVELVEGKLCECNRCGEMMLMTKKAMQLAKPHCDDCTKSFKKLEINSLAKFLEEKEL